jgi:hypothetical protein
MSLPMDDRYRAFVRDHIAPGRMVELQHRPTPTVDCRPAIALM